MLGDAKAPGTCLGGVEDTFGMDGAWSLQGHPEALMPECYKGAIAASQARTNRSKSIQLATTLSPDEGGGGSQWGNHSAPVKVK